MDSGSRIDHAEQNGANPGSQHEPSGIPGSGRSSPRHLGQRLFNTIHDGPTRQTTPSGLPGASSSDMPAGGRLFHPDASLVLIGIRASGKRSLGLIAATALGRRFITEDHYFQSVNGLSRQDYLKAHGAGKFHAQDIETSKRMLEDNKYRCVIECGLVSLTGSFQDYLRRYCETNPVVFVLRDMEQIKTLLNLDERTTRLLEQGNLTHRTCSNFEFYNLEDQSVKGPLESDLADRASPNYSFKLRNAQADFSSFARFITGAHPVQPNSDSPFSLDIPVELRAYTHALFVRLSDFGAEKIDFAALESAGDLLEIHVDHWNSSTSRMLSKMIAVARRALRIPILLSASRQLSEPSTRENHFPVMMQGLRLGVEYMSVDLDSEDSAIAAVRAGKGYTKLVGNYINEVADDVGWRDAKWKNMYNRAIALRFDMVRLLNNPTSRHDNEAWSWFVEELKSLPEPRLIAITFNTGGLEGRTSQIMNPILTSVTHPALPTARETFDRLGPLLSSREVINSLFDCFVFDSLDFFIVGANVSGSLSPAMHNAAYALLGLKHHYSTRNIKSWADIEELARDNTLGGLSIVQPYKVKVVPRLESLSGHAKAIGAVNTLIPLRANSAGVVPSLEVQAQERNRAGRIVGWFGENTDFIGIMNCVQGNLSPRNAIQPRTTALVIGAGGMARAAVYAMLQLGCKHIFVYNRTVENTRAIVGHFNHWAKSQSNGNAGTFTPEPVEVLESTTEPWGAGFLLPTIVVSCVTHELLDGNPGASFEMPESWIQSPSGGVVVEMAYMTRETPLVKQMKRFREATGRPWVIVDGIETLIEQAVAQFESMTGRKAPKYCMADAVHAALGENMSYLADGEEFFT